MVKIIKYTYFFLFSLFLLVLSSCANYKSVPYFQNSASFSGAPGTLYDMTIKPKDKLSIFVFSGNNQEAIAMFNMTDPGELNLTTRNIISSGTFHSYLVDNDGNINFPVLGIVHVANLTIEQANEYIRKQILPYLHEGTDCVVNTYIQNFEISVMGEVQKPNTFTVSRPKVTVLEALAMAGDMTEYGKRENVKILREQSDGTFAIHELDMRDANILNSPYYYLQQRDIVYVEPNPVMAQNAVIGETTQLWVRGASITVSLGSLLYMVLK